VTLTALTYFLENYPKQAPKGIQQKMESWADEMIRRSDNMWDYRRYSDDKWIIPSIRPAVDPTFDSETGFNEVGNIAGFAAPALAVAAHLESAEKQARLEEMAIAYVDHIFGRNPAGRHFGFDAVTDFDGVEMGWYQEYQGGAGILQTARGVLDGSPKETTYPFNSHAGDPGHTEGWVTFNTAWNTGLAYLSSNSIAVKVYDQDFSKEINKAKHGETIGIELKAPLNSDNSSAEKAKVMLHINNELIPLTLTETSDQSTVFRVEYLLQKGLQQKELKISYGYGWHEKQQTIRLR